MYDPAWIMTKLSVNPKLIKAVSANALLHTSETGNTYFNSMVDLSKHQRTSPDVFMLWTASFLVKKLVDALWFKQFVCIRKIATSINQAPLACLPLCLHTLTKALEHEMV